MTARVSTPTTWLTTLIVVVTIGVWGWLRLVYFRDDILTLSFLLPMFLCVWTRRQWQLYLMAAAFVAMTLAKSLWIFDSVAISQRQKDLYLGTTLINILLGTIVVHLLIQMRARVERRELQLREKQAELEAQAEELSAQNEEMSAQAEELSEQNVELETQREEMEEQNRELQAANGRLANREEILHAAVECTRVAGGGRAALEAVCERTMSIVGAPAGALAVLELVEGRLEARAQSVREGNPPLPAHWPLPGSLGQVVVEKDQTAYVDDLQRRPDLSAPLDTAGHYRSALATPVRMGGRAAGLLVVCSREPSHWTQEQFRLLEWAAAQIAPLLDSLRWQEALQQRATTVEAASQAKDQFLAMLSHELRTPLTPVLAAAGALEHDPRLPADVRAELAMMQRNVSVQSRLIDDLLDLTRIARGKLELKPQVLPLAPLLLQAASIVAPELDANEQSLDLDLQLPASCGVTGDGARLQQVFWNLLKNAIKFSPRHSRIALEARLAPAAAEEAEMAVVAVRDPGVGIDPADLERIFQPFEQGNRPRTSGGFGGLGLGLSIAEAIVKLHQGKLRVQSDGAGRGSVFTVELPVTVLPTAGATAVESTSSADGEPLTGARLLLVEDHADTGRVMARLLKRAGFQVVYAESVEKAWAAWQAGEFDLVVSDIGLPDGTGLDLMRKIREVRPTATGVCMSGFGMESDLEASRQAGFAEHLIKPVDMQQMQAAIRRLLSR
jgi:signal transduction histidine kinase/BarA-like signal transduction histidine kinase